MNYQLKNKAFNLVSVFFVCFALIFSLSSAQADQTPVQSGFYYVFHLFLNTSGQLVADHDFKFSYDVIPGQFNQSVVGSSPYSGEIISSQNISEGQFKFDAAPGKLSIPAPYFADAQKVVFYNAQNQPALTISVSDSSYCNDDGVCDAQRGESYQSCPNDCKAGTLPVPSASPVPAATSNSNGIVSAVIYLVVGIVILIVILWFLRRRKNQPPPTLPPSNPSTPAAPPTQGNNV